MVNNIGKTTKTLNTTLGEPNVFTPSDDLTIISGEVGTGFLLFDSDGTVGVITSYIDEESNFVVKTYAISIDIPTILSLSYGTSESP